MRVCKIYSAKITLFFLLLFPLTVIKAQTQAVPDTAYFAQASCEAVIEIYHQYTDSIWPGYDLSRQPFIFYYPEQWVLLLNNDEAIEGFTAYPADWPPLSTHALYYEGTYPGLMGQLAFYFDIDSLSVAAVPVTDTLLERNFTFISHECFHQYQYDNFNEIPWEREEKYPSMDTLNTALVALEMDILADAIRSARADDRADCTENIKKFLAVRKYRWKDASSYLLTFEKGKELSEGTAKYVELKSLSYLERIKNKQKVKEFKEYLAKRIKPYDMAEELLQDYQNRLTGKTLSPEDVPRNRIYFEGAAQCFLLDYLGVDWKSRVQNAGEGFTYITIFEHELNIDTTEYSSLITKAKADYDFDAVLAETEKMITTYENGYRRALDAFEKQPGSRIEISLDTRSGISRSRRSGADRWLMDNGRVEVREYFDVYVLKNKSMTFELHDAGLMEENLWDAHIKTVIFYSDSLNLTLDDKTFDPKQTGEFPFNKLRFEGSNFKLQANAGGILNIGPDRIHIDLK